MRSDLSISQAKDIREHLQDAILCLDAYIAGTEDPEYAWALPVVAGSWARLAGKELPQPAQMPIPRITRISQERAQ